ncbi:histidine kinase [Flavobacterium sp. MAH-1]|uniref:Histidine kinase n=1 Tax=Flavobacterium agri TaxID=2743471 RepID=A0A7Y8Y1D3_9FLAO|nr:histidine kinase [Flavobacterium agri]NUY80573.1 histidine kinase [Flavobacterium agri]NYA70597.1 histidine kinase [Flavobacterium agri]
MENGYSILYVSIAVLASAVVFLSFRLYSVNRFRKISETKFGQLESKVHDLQLENLESRLNPHLFKNILNSIQSHAYQTYFALDKLAGVLDYILYESRKKFVSPKEEIGFAMNLIEINKIKVSPLFDLRIKTKIDETDPSYQREILAPMVVTDLIENAFKHADLQNPDSFISVVFEFSDGTLSLTVSNKISEKKALRKEHSGFGVDALGKRLSILYKERFKLERFSENQVYTAHLKIDLRGFKTEMHTA